MSPFAPVLAAVGLLVATGAALAHAHLDASTPPSGGTVEQGPSEIGLTFSEGVNPRFTGLKLTGPDRKPVATGAARSAPGGDRTLAVPVTAPLSAGAYRVDWHALATDGHRTSGSFTFTVKPQR